MKKWLAALAAALCVLVAGASAHATVIKGCTYYVHGSTPHCAGVWFQEGPGGAYGYGSTAYLRQIVQCKGGKGPCAQTDNTGPVLGNYFDDTTPCPPGLNGSPGTHYYSWAGGYLGAPCVQYWVTDDYLHNPAKGLIYAGLAPGIDGSLSTRFQYATTLLEWYGGTPPSGQQGYILSLSLTQWNYCALHLTPNGVEADY